MAAPKPNKLAGIQWPARSLHGKGIGLDNRTQRFEAVALPHLDAAYSLASWLLKDDHNAHDAVQDAYLRAFRFFDHLKGEEARPWLLAIVRNSCYSLLGKRRQSGEQVKFDEERDSEFAEPSVGVRGGDPETQLLRKIESARLDCVCSRSTTGLELSLRNWR